MSFASMTTDERVGLAAAAYALVFSTIKEWLRGFYGSATRSIASAIICALVILNLWSGLRMFNKSLAFSLVIDWKVAFFLAGIFVCAAVDLAFVETGKVDRWETQSNERWPFARRHRHLLCAGLIAFTGVNFLWPPFAG